MTTHMDKIHDALKQLYPGIDILRDYTWAMDYTVDPPVPQMTMWNTSKLGPLNMPAIEQKCLELDGAPPPGPTQPAIIAMAELTVVDFDLTGIESATCLGAAFFIDVGIIWVFFAHIQPNTQYLPFAQCPGFNADVTAREVDYFEITVTDRATNQPAMPGSVSISVQRVV